MELYPENEQINSGERKKKKSMCRTFRFFLFTNFFFFVFIYKKYKMTESKSILTTDYAIDF